MSTYYSDHKHHVCMEMMKGEVAEAVLEAIRESHDDVKVSDLPGYVVVEIPDRVAFSAEAVRSHLGRNDWVMTDLNEVLHAFAGTISTYTEDDFALTRPTLKREAR